MNDAERQTELYSEIWAKDPGYGTAASDVRDTVMHRVIPHMERVFTDLDAAIRVIDFGAGDGRFLRELWKRSFADTAVGIDLYRPVRLAGWLDWEQVPMWEATSRGNYVISTDALEHLPPARVNDSLRAIADAAPHGFLRISLQEDRYGTERGLHLHESVFSSREWLNRFRLTGIRPSSYRVYLAPGRLEIETALEVWF